MHPFRNSPSIHAFPAHAMSEEVVDVVRRDREIAASASKSHSWMSLLPGVGEAAAALYDSGDLLGAIAATKEEQSRFPAASASGALLAEQLEVYEEIGRVKQSMRTNDEIDSLRSKGLIEQGLERVKAALEGAPDNGYLLSLRRELLAASCLGRAKKCMSDASKLRSEGKLDEAISLVEAEIAQLVQHVVLPFASPHPYENNTEDAWQVSIAGATQIRVEFDAQTATENNYDYLQFFKDSSRTSCWGADRYTGAGAWPGVGEAPPLLIDSDKFFVRFHSDGSNTDWGYAFTASALTPFRSEEADLDALLRELEGARAAARCAEEAMACRAKGDLAGAVLVARRGLSLGPSDALRATARSLEELFAAEGVDATLAKASALQAKDDAQGALELLRAALEVLPASQSLRLATDNLQEAVRLAALTRSLRLYAELCAKDEVAGALAALGEGLREFPGHPLLTKLLAARTESRSRRVADAIAAATALLESNSIEAAADAIRGGLEADPTMQELLDLRDEVDKLARLAACDRLLEQAADLKDRGELDASLELIGRGLAMEPLHVRRVEQLFESLHPYLNSTDMKWTVCIPGAEELVIAFDSQTRTEQSYDWLLLTNADSTTTYGRYSGTSRSTWPGAEDGSAPLVVPGDSCSLHFHSDGSNTDWGFKFTVTGAIVLRFGLEKFRKLERTVQALKAAECASKGDFEGALLASKTTADVSPEMLEKMNASLVAAAKMQLSADEMRVTELIEAGDLKDALRIVAGSVAKVRECTMSVEVQEILSALDELYSKIERDAIQRATVLGDTGDAKGALEMLSYFVAAATTWNKAISNQYLEFSDGDRSAKRPESVSSYPAGIATIPAQLSQMSVVLTSAELSQNSLSFGIVKPEFPRESSDGVGMSTGSWGIIDNRTEGNTYASQVSCNGTEVQQWRKLKLGDTLTASVDLAAGWMEIRLNAEAFHRFEIPPGAAGDYLFAATFANNHVLTIPESFSQASVELSDLKRSLADRIVDDSIKATVADCSECVRKGEYDRAMQVAEDGLKRSPSHEPLLALRRAIIEKQIEPLLISAAGKRDSGDVRGAYDTVQEGLKLDASSVALKALNKGVASALRRMVVEDTRASVAAFQSAGDVDSALKALASAVATLSSVGNEGARWCAQSEVRSFCAEDDFCEVLAVGVDRYYNEIRVRLLAHGSRDLGALCLASSLHVNEEELRLPAAEFVESGPNELRAELTYTLPAIPDLNKLSFSFGSCGYESAGLRIIGGGGDHAFDADRRGADVYVEGHVAGTRAAPAAGADYQCAFATRCFDLTKGCEDCNYFEVRVHELGKYIVVGLASPEFTEYACKLPGWTGHSYGYHGDDGLRYTEGSRQDGSTYPLFQSGDVIGCGIDFREKSIFFTHNGAFLGTGFPIVSDACLYPVVGFGPFNEQPNPQKVSINFGESPFVYNGAEIVFGTLEYPLEQVFQSLSDSIGDKVNVLRDSGKVEEAIQFGKKLLELRSVSYSKSTEASILSVVEWVLRASAIAEGAQDFESALWLARHACEYSSSENVRSLISSLEERIRISKLEIAFRQAKDLEELGDNEVALRFATKTLSRFSDFPDERVDHLCADLRDKILKMKVDSAVKEAAALQNSGRIEAAYAAVMKGLADTNGSDEVLLKMRKNLEEIVQRKSINDVIAQALNFQIQGDILKAIEAVDKCPVDSSFLVQLRNDLHVDLAVGEASELLKKGQHSSALESINTGLSYDAQNAKLLKMKSEFKTLVNTQSAIDATQGVADKQSSGDIDGALEMVAKGIEDDPSNFRLLIMQKELVEMNKLSRIGSIINVALAFESQGDIKGALSTIQSGLEIEKENEYLTSLNAELTAKQKEKLVALQQEARADFDSADYSNALQKYDNAIDFLNELSVESHRNRYTCAFALEKWQSAAESASACVDKGDHSAAAYTNLAAVFLKQGNYRGMSDALREGLKDFPADDGLLRLKSELSDVIKQKSRIARLKAELEDIDGAFDTISDVLFASGEDKDLASIMDELLPSRVSSVMARCNELAVQLLTKEVLDLGDLDALLATVQDALVVDAGRKDLQKQKRDIENRVSLMSTAEKVRVRADELETRLPQVLKKINDRSKGKEQSVTEAVKKSIHADLDDIKKTATALQADITLLQAQVQKLDPTSDFVRQFVRNSTDLDKPSSLREGAIKEYLDSLVNRIDACLDTEAEYEGMVSGSGEDTSELGRYKVFVEEIRNLPGYKENPLKLKSDVNNENSDLILQFKRKTGIKDTRDAKVMWNKVNRYMASDENAVLKKAENSQIGVDSSSSSLAKESTIWTVLEEAEEDATTLAKLIRKDASIVNLIDPNDGNMPLHDCAQSGRLESIKLICSVPGINIDALNMERQSPLYLAVSEGCYDVAKYLVGRGASIAPLDVKSGTAGENALAISARKSKSAGSKVDADNKDYAAMTRYLLSVSPPEHIYAAARQELLGMYSALVQSRLGVPVNALPTRSGLLYPNEHLFCTSNESLAEQNSSTEESSPEQLMIARYSTLFSRIQIEQLIASLFRKKGALSAFRDYIPPFVDSMIEHKRQSYYSVEEYELPIKFATDIRFLKACLEVSQKLQKPEFFSNDVIQCAVACAWKSYGRGYHVCLCAVYVVYLAVVTVSNYRFHQWVVSADYLAVCLAYALVGASIFLNSFFVAYEFQQIVSAYKENLLANYFFSDFQNAIDWSSHILIYVANSYRIAYRAETYESASIMAVATLLIWLKSLYFFRPFKATGPLIRMVFFIFFSIQYFIVIILVVIFSFSQSFYLLSYSDESLDFSDPSGSIIHTFLYMMGGSDLNQMLQTINPALAQFLLCAFIFLSTILLLNLLIALMNSSFGKIKDNEEAEWNRERARIMIEQYRPWTFTTSKYVYYLVREDDRIDVLKIRDDMIPFRLKQASDDAKTTKGEVISNVQTSKDEIIVALKSVSEKMGEVDTLKAGLVDVLDKLRLSTESIEELQKGQEESKNVLGLLKEILLTGSVSYVQSNLVCHLELRSTDAICGGIIRDESGNKRDFSVVNSPVYSATKGGVHFSSSLTQWLRSPDVGFALQRYTLEVWVRPDNNGVVLSHDDEATHYPLIELAAGEIRVGGMGTSGELMTLGLGKFSADTWYQIVCTHDGTTLTGYVNGAKKGHLNYSRRPETASTSYNIGKGGSINVGDGGYFGGTLSIVRYYSEALTPFQVSRNYDHSSKHLNDKA